MLAFRCYGLAAARFYKDAIHLNRILLPWCHPFVLAPKPFVLLNSPLR